MKVICVVWGPFGHRMDELAAAVNASRVNLTVLYGPRYLAPVRYFVLFFWTLLLLWREDPDVVYCQNPPIFCPLSCLLFCSVTRRRLVVDHHSIWTVKTINKGPVAVMIGAMERAALRMIGWNTVPHPLWGKKLRDLGARNLSVIHDFVERNKASPSLELKRKYAGRGFLVLASHGGHPLERIEVEADAMSLLESVTLVITGPEEKLARRLSRSRHHNVRYLGFLEPDEYQTLKASADFALNITDEPFTLSHVLLEFVASSLPTISSKQAAVQQLLGNAVLYADSTAAAVAGMARRFVESREELLSLKQNAAKKYEELSAERERELKVLRAVIFG